MKINTLKLQNFKNYNDSFFEFSHRLNLISGLNGVGKTNLLDAIHYLAFTKSAFNSTDVQNINNSSKYFLIKGAFENNDSKSTITCYQELNQKKIFRINDNEYEKYSDHIGKIPVIMSTPYDNDLIRNSSDTRRKWADGCISQYNQDYLKALLDYQKTLKQRNSLLKQMDKKSVNNYSLLDTYDHQIIHLSKILAAGRHNFIDEFLPYFNASLASIIDEKESYSIKYNTNTLSDLFEQHFKQARNKDIVNMRTSLGCHKDDFVFRLNDSPIKKFGSQGQHKSFLLAIRLAQYNFLASIVKMKPILLLDDVFDKLDDKRIVRIIELMEDSNQFGQIFITDARSERSKKYLVQNKEMKVFEIGK